MENQENNRFMPEPPKAPGNSSFYMPAPLGDPIKPQPSTPAAPSAAAPRESVVEPASEPVSHTAAAEVPAHEPAPITPPAAPSRYTPEPPKKKKRTGAFIALIVCIGLCCSLIGGALGALAYSHFWADKAKNADSTEEEIKISNKDDGKDHGKEPADNTGDGQSNTVNTLEGLRENSVIDVTEIDTSKQLTAAEVYAQNVKSTVGITTSVTTNWFGYESTSAASGSGFIISDDGYIVTNFHVIENSNSISVALYDGDQYDATLIGYDESNDLAILKIEAEDLPPVILGDSSNINVGDPVVAIGNPLGELTFSLTSGTVSAMDRSVTMSNGLVMDLIQTDCAINSGNSGGALFNLYGEVIGITNAKYSSPAFGASIDNIGFAIPMNDVKDIIYTIIEDGYISKPYIGVSVIDVSEESQSYGVPAGAAVREVVKDSPAEESGLKKGDIITHVNGEQISSSNDLVEIVSEANVGDELLLTVYRKNDSIEITLVVGEQTQSMNQTTEN